MAVELDRIVPTVDLVHTHLPFNYPCFAAARAAFRHGKPLFYHQRGVFDSERLRFRSVKKLPYIRLIERPILRRATTLIALTTAEEHSYRRLGVSTPCRIIPNGIDVRKYAPQQSTDLIQPLGIRPDHKVILFLSRIHPIKGAHTLLDAFFQMQEIEPDALLVLAGPDEFGLEAKFKRRALASKLKGKVIFPGMVQGELKLQLLRRADLFCLPSDAEGFSMAILEAMASGTPVLISPGCHFPEVHAYRAGRIAPPHAGALANALAEMLRDPGELKAMGVRARSLVASNYTWDSVANATVDAYIEGIARHRMQQRAIPQYDRSAHDRARFR
jgi:glycosyltransferase involved in cell wall biosynthesis